MDHLLALLSSYRYDSTSEAVFQAGIERVLIDSKTVYEREVILNDGTIDFVSAGTGIEAKIKGNRMAVLRQCARYLKDPHINGLILISSKRSIINGIPVTLEGKRFAALYVGSPF